MQDIFKQLQFFFLALLLVSCAHQQEQSVGRYPVKGICRSCQPHMVRGSWYTPQLHYDYDETNVASWYGPGFHNKPKANGQIFDQNDLSAAHRTLPLPTVVQVTNLQNGKKINLVVDDRGPYTYDGRIIDLSVAAAKAIGIHAKGTGKVRVQSIPAQSHALSLYLARHGNKWGVVSGRTWTEIYHQEIAPHFSNAVYEEGMPISPTPVPGYGSHHSGAALEVVPLVINSPEDTGTSNLDQLIATHAEPQATRQKVPVMRQEKAAPQKNRDPAPLGATAPSRYFIQLASFVKRENAVKLVREVSPLSTASVREVVVPPGQKFYAVYCGPYTKKDTADMMLTSLDVLGHNPKIVKE